MKAYFRKTTALFLAIFLIFSTAACGSDNDSAVQESIPVNSSEESTSTVRVWISSGAEDDIYRTMFEEMEVNLNITIEDEYYPKDELDSKLQVAPVVGDTPDMLILDYLTIPGLHEAGMIEDISQRMPESLKSDMLQSVLDEAAYDGKLLATAQFDSGMAMWANKSMLENAGVRIPVSYKDAWDRTEFEDALKKLKESGVPYPIYLRQNKPASLYFTYMPIVASFGGDYLNRETLLASDVLDSAETIAAYEYLNWLGDNSYMNRDCDYEDAFFGKKESALALLGHWKYADHVANLGDDAILIPVPDFGNGVRTCSGSVVWAMTTAATTNGTADLVWSVMEDGLSANNINTITTFNGAIPSRKSVLDTKEELQPGGRLYLYREQLEAGISVLRPLTPAHMTIYSAMENATSDIIATGAMANEILPETAAYIDEIIIENEWDVATTN